MSSEKKCSSCGFVNAPFADKCSKCGFPLAVAYNVPIIEENSGEPSKVCPSCGFENELAAMMCIMCGHDLPADMPDSASDDLPAGQPKLETKSVLPKLCAQCNWKNDYTAEVCFNCGAKLPKFLASAGKPRPPRSPVPLILFWLIFLAAIFVAGYLVYAKIIVPATDASRLLKVQNDMKDFYLIARDFASDHSGLYWENGKFPFGERKIRFDYKYRYFGDDADDNDENKSGMFVILAVPLNLTKGKQAYFIDESGTLFVADLTSQARLDTVTNMSYDDIDWEVPAMTMAPSRCDIKGIEFKHFNSGLTVGN